MRLISMLFAALTLVATPSFAQPAASDKKMNVLFIAVDDLRPQLGCYGQSQMKTPNIDALAKSGLLFNRAYCQQAVCSPSRTSLLTGLRPDSTKVYDLQTHFRDTIPDVITLPQHFKTNGYYAQSFGKIYHGGLDDKASWSAPHTPADGQTYGSPEIMAHLKAEREKYRAQGSDRRVRGPAWESADVPDDKLPDGTIAAHAIAVLNRVKDKPFFLAVGFLKPHLPFVAPRKYFDLYPIESIQLPPDMQRPKDAPEFATTDSGELRAYDGMPKKGPVPDEQAKELIRAYYAATSYMDAQVGRVLAELDKLDLAENTIVILWGDHGWHLGEQGSWCKHTNFENATRAALIIRAPGRERQAGAATDALVEFVDIYPTLCELTGLSLPDGLEGQSFVPLLADPSRPWKRAAFSQYPRGKEIMGYSMRTDRRRYTEWRSPDGKAVARELYDHQTDPRETVNIADASEQAETVAGLSKQLTDGWRAAAAP